MMFLGFLRGPPPLLPLPFVYRRRRLIRIRACARSSLALPRIERTVQTQF